MLWQGESNPYIVYSDVVVFRRYSEWLEIRNIVDRGEEYAEYATAGEIEDEDEDEGMGGYWVTLTKVGTSISILIL